MTQQLETEQTEYTNFTMRVETTLRDEFQEACGAASMALVTKALWRQFINSNSEAKARVIFPEPVNES